VWYEYSSTYVDIAFSLYPSDYSVGFDVSADGAYLGLLFVKVNVYWFAPGNGA
jgi:hypothetical protein